MNPNKIRLRVLDKKERCWWEFPYRTLISVSENIIKAHLINLSDESGLEQYIGLDKNGKKIWKRLQKSNP